MTKKKQVGVRFDSNRTRLKTGETQRPNGTYAYRWSTPDGKSILFMLRRWKS